MAKILVFRTAQNHICERAFSMIQRKYNGSSIDYFSNQDYYSVHVDFSKKYIVDYQEFLDIKNVPTNVKEEIKKRKYDYFVFPYSIWGTKSVKNLLEISKHLKPKKIIFVNELDDGEEKSIIHFDLCLIKDYVLIGFLFIPIFILALIAYLKNIICTTIQQFQVKADITVIRGTTNIQIGMPEEKQDGSVKIGCIARLDPIKGQKYLIEAFCQLVKDGFNNIELILIGGGAELTFIKELINDLNINDKISCVGFQEDIIPYLKTCDLFVLPSLNEAMPISLFEVMAAGKPIIASRVGDIPNIINHRENGILINPKSEREIYIALKELILSPEMRFKIGLNAYRTFHQNYSPDKFAEKYSHYYQKVIQGNNIGEKKKVWVFTIFNLISGGIKSYVFLLKSTVDTFIIEIPIIPRYINFMVKSFYLNQFPKIFQLIFPYGEEMAYYSVRKTFLLYVFLKYYKEQPDIIHVHDVLSYNALKFLCWLFSIPLILTKHGDLAKEMIIKFKIDKNGCEYKYFSNQEKAAYKNAKHLIVVDEESKKRLSNGDIA